MKNNYKTKRFLSFCIDIFITSLIILLLTKVNFLNPNRSKYEDAYEKYVSYASELVNSNVSTSIDSEYIELNYKVQYYGISYLLIYFCVYVLYFTLFSYFNHGQTIGKKIFKLHYERINGDNIKIYQYFLRSLILPVSISFVMCTPVSYLLNVLIVLIFKHKTYLYISEIVALIICAYCYADIIYLLSNRSQNNYALHDKITGICVKEN